MAAKTTKVPTLRRLRRIKQAARLFVEGWTWDKIAGLHGYRNGESARVSLQGHHPSTWRAEYDAARELYLPALEAEAELTQRGLLRSKDENIRQRAAHSLLAHADRLKAQKLQVTGDLTHEHAVSTTALIHAATNGDFKRTERLNRLLAAEGGN